MSENSVTKTEEIITDMSAKDIERVEKYKEAGLPGLVSLGETKLQKVMDLYLSGKTYTQISQIMRLDKSLILYLSDRFKWYDRRMEYLQELEQHMRHRIFESKVVSQDFLLQLTQLWQVKIGGRINKYLASGDEDVADGIDLKEIDKYLKTIEMLHKFAENKEGKPTNPAVGLNLGDGVTVTRLNGNSVEITPKQKSIGDMLKQFADSRREEESKLKTNKKSDIEEKADEIVVNEGDPDET